MVKSIILAKKDILPARRRNNNGQVQRQTKEIIKLVDYQVIGKFLPMPEIIVQKR